MNKLINYSLSSVSFIIIGGVFLSLTSHGYQSYSAQEEGEEISGINTEEESSNDIFSDLSRNLPSIEEDIPEDNKESLNSERPIFENQDTKDLDDNNEIGSSTENIVGSNDQGTSSESIEKSLSNELSDSDQESGIINEDESSSDTETSSSSSSNSVSNDETEDQNIINRWVININNITMVRKKKI